MSVIQCPVQINAEVLGDNPAIISAGQTLSYQAFHKAVSDAVNRFRNIGINYQDRVVILDFPSIKYIISLIALWRIGAVACPVSTRLPFITLQEHLINIKAKYLITSLKEVLGYENLSCRLVDLDYFIRNTNPPIEKPEQNTYPLNQIATILLTSGSSAKPKAVAHTFRNHIFNAKGANEHILIQIKDRWLLSLPLYHVGGLSIIFRILIAGGTIVIPAANEEIAASIIQNDITHVSVVSTQLFRILQNFHLGSIKKLKSILVGGSAVSDVFIQRAVDNNLPIYLTYGLTEMSSQVATSDKILKVSDKKKLKVLNYRDVSISNDSEILVKGDTLCKGYLEENLINLPLDTAGWFHTKDLGRLSPDGFLEIIGRKDNMFISGGENIQPEEIEECLQQFKGVRQAIVVPIVSEEFGQRPVAFIQVEQQEKVTTEKLRTHLKIRLPSFKIPDTFIAWPESLKEEDVKVNRLHLIHLAQEKLTQLQIIS